MEKSAEPRKTNFETGEDRKRNDAQTRERNEWTNEKMIQKNAKTRKRKTEAHARQTEARKRKNGRRKRKKNGTRWTTEQDWWRVPPPALSGW